MSDIDDMRMPPGGRRPKRSFMAHDAVREIRVKVLKVTQRALAKNLIDPSTGDSISSYLICKWEKGDRAVPLWAARHIKVLHAAALEYDKKGK